MPSFLLSSIPSSLAESCDCAICIYTSQLQTVRMSTNHGVCTSFYTKVCNLCLILPIMDLSFCSPVNIRDHIITVLLRTLQFFLPYLFLLGLFMPDGLQQPAPSPANIPAITRFLFIFRKQPLIQKNFWKKQKPASKKTVMLLSGSDSYGFFNFLRGLLLICR